MRALVNPAYDAGRGAGAVERGAGRSTARWRATRRRRCATWAAGVWLKDESSRLGLPAFKVLGASWAVERALREDPDDRTRWSRPAPATTAARSRTWPRCAGCAAASSCRRARSRPRRAAIAGEGAEVVVVDGTYEDAVARAAAEGARPGCVRARRRRRLRPGALGDRRLRDAVLRARGRVRRRCSCPSASARSARPRRAGARAPATAVIARRAGRRGLPDRLAGGRRADVVIRRRARRWRAWTAPRSPRRPGRRCAPASAGRSPSTTPRPARRCASSPPPAWRSATAAPHRSPRCARSPPTRAAGAARGARARAATRVLLIATEGPTDPDGYRERRVTASTTRRA